MHTSSLVDRRDTEPKSKRHAPLEMIEASDDKSEIYQKMCKTDKQLNENPFDHDFVLPDNYDKISCCIAD